MPVRARDAVVNDNEPGSVQKPAPRESQIGIHIQLRWFAVENLLLCWERREFSRSRSIFLEGNSSDRAGTQCRRNECRRDGSWADHGRAKRCARGARRVLAWRCTDQCSTWRAAIVRARIAVSVALPA